MTENYSSGLSFLASQYEEVNGYDFYRDIFPKNQNVGETSAEPGQWQTNAVYLYKDAENVGKRRRLTRRIMFKDTWERDYADNIEENPMTLCSGLTYRGRANTLNSARQMNALIFDLDGVGERQLNALFHLFEADKSNPWRLPMPTYIVLSGSGIHVYYVFREPIALYPNIKMQMKQLKYTLTSHMWLYGSTSQLEKVQYQSINQGFRMVGSVNGKYGTTVRAFRVGNRVTLDHINEYVRDEKSRVDVNRPFRPSQITREAAAEKYPEWYQRVVVNGDKKPKKWDIAGQKGHKGDELYNWWLRQVHNDRLAGGHRYFYMMCLAIYASKCDIPKQRLKKDMQDVFVILKEIEHVNELTQDDVQSALEAYGKEYYNYTIDDIKHLTDIWIERNKRNGRKQRTHLRLARATKDILKDEGQMRPEGRPSARHRVEDYRQQNPEAKPKECITATGLSKNTVYKWWNARTE